MNIAGIRYERFSPKDERAAKEVLSQDADAGKTSFECWLKNRICLLYRISETSLWVWPK